MDREPWLPVTLEGQEEPAESVGGECSTLVVPDICRRRHGSAVGICLLGDLVAVAGVNGAGLLPEAAILGRALTVTPVLSHISCQPQPAKLQPHPIPTPAGPCGVLVARVIARRRLLKGGKKFQKIVQIDEKISAIERQDDMFICDNYAVLVCFNHRNAPPKRKHNTTTIRAPSYYTTPLFHTTGRPYWSGATSCRLQHCQFCVASASPTVPASHSRMLFSSLASLCPALPHLNFFFHLLQQSRRFPLDFTSESNRHLFNRHPRTHATSCPRHSKRRDLHHGTHQGRCEGRSRRRCRRYHPRR